MEEGRTILEAAKECGLETEGPCAGAGTCEKCKVQIYSEASTLGAFSLACITEVFEDVRIEIPKVGKLFLVISL